MGKRFTDDRSLTTNLGSRGGVRVTAPDPTPEEIEAAAAEIRAGWSEHGRRNRHWMGEFRVRSLEPLTVNTRDLPTST